jgi:hypothetical protein
MRASTLWSHRVLRMTVTSVAAVALIAVGVSAAATGDGDHGGPGYPPPGGIYKAFTNCPLRNPLMQESTSGDATGCIDGQIQSGSVTVGNITTQVVEPVDVQFGAWDPPNASAGGDNPAGGQWAGGVLPPPSGLSDMVVTKADPIPESLTTALGCPSTDATVESICQQAAANPRLNQVSALAQGAGQLTNFELFSWTQRIKFQLLNPLLGDNCYIGSDNNPIVLNPQVSIGPGGSFFGEPDPNPTKHPNVEVLGISGAVATDNTFAAPGVTGCGPGGANNIPVDLALDAGTGLPAAAGNSAVFNGTLEFADSFNSSNQASILLSAFRDSSNSEGQQTAGKFARSSITASALAKYGIHRGG